MDDAPATRREIEALQRRIETLERLVMPRPPPGGVRCPACASTVPAGRFCAVCGAPLPAQSPPPAAPAAPPPVASSPVAPRPAAPAAPRAPLAPAPAAALSMERMLGQRFAPRIGAALVFLGVLFFLGVAIQRGWVGPLAQLAIAALAGLALLAGGAWLTARRGYGTYPQVLEGTGACILYLTAFVAHALPYYRAETALTELGSAILMAAVALGTVGLALWRDARVIAALGFGLAFLTALLGLDVLPGLTLAYVSLLGIALALLVARKGWLAEGALGTLATGGLLLALAWQADLRGTPPPALVGLAALAAAAAYLWLALRPPSAEHDGPLSGVVAAATFAWTAGVLVGVIEGSLLEGSTLLALGAVAGAHAALGARRGAASASVAGAAVSGIVLWLVGAPLAWSDASDAALLVTATYAAGAVLLALLAGRGGGAWAGAVALALAAAASALFAQGLVRPPWDASEAIGPWDAWLTLALVALPLVLVAASPRALGHVRLAAFWALAAFATFWTFALFGAPFLATTWLLLVGGALVGLALARAQDPALATPALAAGAGVLLLAAVKTASVDTYVEEVRLDALAAALQGAMVLVALLALFHLARARGAFSPQTRPLAAAVLVGGGAAVVANYLLAYTEGAATSILLGVAGVAYLAAGFVRRHEIVYRYTGFALLGFVVLRVFLVDLQETDLALRALVFAVLGAILLGIGYAYARLSRRQP